MLHALKNQINLMTLAIAMAGCWLGLLLLVLLLLFLLRIPMCRFYYWPCTDQHFETNEADLCNSKEKYNKKKLKYTHIHSFTHSLVRSQSQIPHTLTYTSTETFDSYYKVILGLAIQPIFHCTHCFHLIRVSFRFVRVTR